MKPRPMPGDLEKLFYTTHEYTPADIYRDFNAVFQGSEQGMRVYRELIKWGGLYRANPARKDATELDVYFSLGERNMALKLIAAVNVEPPRDQPKKAVSRRPKRAG